MDLFSPLRYPGGKGKLANYIKNVYELNCLDGGYYIEPYAGGSSVALSLLINEYALRVYINDIDRSIYAFWYSILNYTDDFCRLLTDTKTTINEWRKQKDIQKRKDTASLLELGFSTFYLNRTNRSGILTGGVIGGLQQNGNYKMDARYNKKNLLERIKRIALFNNRISLYNLDGCAFVRQISPSLPRKSLLYFDPPYYVKGKALYQNFFQHKDHADVANLVSSIRNNYWIVSYDSISEIKQLYNGFRSLEYKLDYCAAGHSRGNEVMFFSDAVTVPKISNPLL